MKTLLKKLSLLLALVLLVATMGVPALAEEESHLNVAMFLWMEGLDPAIGWNGWTTMRTGVGETLLTANEDMEVVPCLSDS